MKHLIKVTRERVEQYAAECRAEIQAGKKPSSLNDILGGIADLRGANLNFANLVGVNLEGANLSDASLYFANLEGANLEGANLSKANLKVANLVGVTLRGADLERANLSMANLHGADLESANLRGADLERANFSMVNLRGADLEGINYIGASFSGADLEGANLPETLRAAIFTAPSSATNLAGAAESKELKTPAAGSTSPKVTPDFKKVTREEVEQYAAKCRLDIKRGNSSYIPRSLNDILGKIADLSEVNLAGVDLSEANLEGANLSRANLSGANLERAILNKADLAGANLSKANLSEAKLNEASLEGANLAGAKLRFAELEGANLRGADLERANLSSANLRRTNLEGVNHVGANFKGADLEGANLPEALRAAIFTAPSSATNLAGAAESKELKTPAAGSAYSSTQHSASSKISHIVTSVTDNLHTSSSSPRAHNTLNDFVKLHPQISITKILENVLNKFFNQINALKSIDAFIETLTKKLSSAMPSFETFVNKDNKGKDLPDKDKIINVTPDVIANSYITRVVGGAFKARTMIDSVKEISSTLAVGIASSSAVDSRSSSESSNLSKSKDSPSR
jgi:uncharacterized protein YjbI with pentapeptide repeats